MSKSHWPTRTWAWGPASRKLDDGRYEVTFRYKPPAGTKEVYLAGEFNGWKPADLKMDGPGCNGNVSSGSERWPQAATNISLFLKARNGGKTLATGGRSAGITTAGSSLGAIRPSDGAARDHSAC